ASQRRVPGSGVSPGRVPVRGRTRSARRSWNAARRCAGRRARGARPEASAGTEVTASSVSRASAARPVRVLSASSASWVAVLRARLAVSGVRPRTRRSCGVRVLVTGAVCPVPEPSGVGLGLPRRWGFSTCRGGRAPMAGGLVRRQPDHVDSKGATVIEVRGLTIRYGGTLAVDDLTFTVKPGSVTGFLGPNGAGKSSTMRAVLGLETPDAGEALVNGRPYTD